MTMGHMIDVLHRVPKGMTKIQKPAFIALKFIFLHDTCFDHHIPANQFGK